MTADDAPTDVHVANFCRGCLTVGVVLLAEPDGTLVCSRCYERRNVTGE